MKTLAATTLALAALAQAATAMPSFRTKVPNAFNLKGVPGLGHRTVWGGGALNEFGIAFLNAGLVWTKELCEADSDGDGQTNGQELGDPCCKWVRDKNEKVLWTTGVSHPGLALSKADPALWANVKC